MTTEEKREAIKYFCKSNQCATCKFRGNKYCEDYSIIGCSASSVEEWYGYFFAESEKVNHPAHYQGKHECIDEMIELFGVEAVIGFCKCNVYKYKYRSNQKNGEEDLEKADWYMDKLIDLQEEEGRKVGFYED